MLELCFESMALPLSNQLRNTLQPVALDKVPAKLGMRVDPSLGGAPNIQNTKTYCEFFQTKFRCPGTRWYSESAL